MYQRIVVPLDGSEFEEQALPHAEALARQNGAALHLVRVVERPARRSAWARDALGYRRRSRRHGAGRRGVPQPGQADTDRARAAATGLRRTSMPVAEMTATEVR